MANQQVLPLRLIVGLGNPGAKYEYTRHNFGFLVVEELARRHTATWRTKGESLVAELALPSSVLYLVKPQTFMNSSGRALAPFTKKGITPQDILVVHDELELPFGRFAIKLGGSARGHNGLKSIIGTVGDQFYRLRCGIGRPDDRAIVPDYVLSSFGCPWSDVEPVIATACDQLEEVLL